MVWWRLAPQTGKPDGDYPAPVDDSCVYLDDGALDATGNAATEIEESFGASRHFSDEEVCDLLLGRVPPASVGPWSDAAADLIQLVDALWQLVDECYHEAFGRPATPTERDFLYRYAYSLLRLRRDSSGEQAWRAQARPIMMMPY